MNYGIDDVSAIGAAIAAAVMPGDAIGLSGELGAGKTTLARAILAPLELVGEAPSPSFAIVQPYDDAELRIPTLHVDLYRIDDIGDIAELGLDEMRRDHLLLLEWPERLGAFAWPDMARLRIDTIADDRRRLTARLPVAWTNRWPLPL